MFPPRENHLALSIVRDWRPACDPERPVATDSFQVGCKVAPRHVIKACQGPELPEVRRR